MKQQAPERKKSAVEVEQARRADLLARVNELLCQTTGVKSAELANQLVSQVDTLQVWGSQDKNVDGIAAAVGALGEIKPQGALQALLATQMLGVHHAAILFLKLATIDGQTSDGADRNVHRASRLLRLFNDQLEAMAKLQGKAGRQTVTVEHVHVHEGGQAIVGAVRAKGNRSESDP